MDRKGDIMLFRIAYAFPRSRLTNADLVKCFPEWTEEKIFQKTGISSRHVASGDEDALSLAEAACEKLFSQGVDRGTVDFILLCSQSAKYRLPSSACILQDRLGIPKTAGALDYDLGCSGFVYGLALAKGLVKGGMAKRVLLVTAETYTKYIGAMDKSTRTIFGDGAAATLVDESVAGRIGEFSFGTDGGGAEKLILKDGGHLFMDGPEIFNFTLDVVPSTMDDICSKNEIARDDVDLFVFHQANKFMLDTIRKVNHIPAEKFYVDMEDTGNTVSSTIPIALERARENGMLCSGMKVMILGFGVGLSWGGTILQY